MNKKELVSQLTALVEGYTDGLISANNKLFHSMQREGAEKQEWERKYHIAMSANKKFEEQNGILQQESASLATLNETLSTESQNWQGQCAELRGQYSLALKELDTSRQIAEHWRTESLRISLKKTEVEEQRERAEETAKHWFREFEALKEELAEKESSWSKAFAAAEERYEEKKKEITKLEYQVISAEERYQDLQDEFEASKRRQVEYHKKAENILATMGENLQKKQERIEALTGWKLGAVSALGTLEKELKDAKDVIHTQENTIEWLDGRVRRLKAKKAKKEQND